MISFIAHKSQKLHEHLMGVAKLAKIHAQKIGMANYGELLGLLHDLGKYSNKFQNYINQAIKKNDPNLNPDEDEGYEDSSGKKGRIDHSTAGAQYLSRNIQQSNAHRVIGQILSLCLVSHHSGVIDCLTTDSRGTVDTYSNRLSKNHDKTHLFECAQNIDKEILNRINEILTDQDFTKPFEEICRNIVSACPEKRPDSVIAQFHLGLLVRFLFSVLIDADRQDTADSENLTNKKIRLEGQYTAWESLISRLEKKYRSFDIKGRIDEIRRDVAEHCLRAASRPKGLFTLTVPTGGGKTLASLRFALHHAKKHKLDRIIYIVPFTTIIDQNAAVVRSILEPKGAPEEAGKIVLEHHSNIGSEVQSWKEKLLTENWDAPIIFTTMVQFLEAFFGSGTRGARRTHQLARSVIIFDEIQTLSIKCVHLFNNAINFLVNYCSSTVVLCTATQPLLGEVDAKKGSLKLSKDNEIMPNVGKLFDDLQRVHVHDCRKPSGWTYPEISTFAIDQVKRNGNSLIVVNTKKAARKLFHETRNSAFEVFHLSTAMCPRHRKQVLAKLSQKLCLEKQLLCISTQLIEAGIDIDFRCVIRLLAGLDSIAQAAGRCNRHGKPEIGQVFIVNTAEENLDRLDEIRAGQDKAQRVLDDFREKSGKYGDDIIGPEMLCWYYKNYFYDRKDLMDYPFNFGSNDTLLRLLSTNDTAVADFYRCNNKMPSIHLRQSFMTANKIFKAIDAPTQSVIVQYDKEGIDLVGQLCAVYEIEKQYSLIKKAQHYSVNLFPHEFQVLMRKGAILRVQKDTEIYYLDTNYYSKFTGLSLEPVEKEEQFANECFA